MISNLVYRFKLLFSTCFISALVACGGGGTGVDAVQSFTSALTFALSTIGVTPASYTSFTFLLDPTYKQDGITKNDLVAILAADATSIPADPSFPVVNYSNPVISNCTSANICDLTVTASNSDVDLISTTLTLKVINTSSGYKLFGDQSAS
jgi:hypothetical protein